MAATKDRLDVLEQLVRQLVTSKEPATVPQQAAASKKEKTQMNVQMKQDGDVLWVGFSAKGHAGWSKAGNELVASSAGWLDLSAAQGFQGCALNLNVLRKS